MFLSSGSISIVHVTYVCARAKDDSAGASVTHTSSTAAGFYYTCVSPFSRARHRISCRTFVNYIHTHTRVIIPAIHRRRTHSRVHGILAPVWSAATSEWKRKTVSTYACVRVCVWRKPPTHGYRGNERTKTYRVNIRSSLFSNTRVKRVVRCKIQKTRFIARFGRAFENAWSRFHIFRCK